MGDNILWTL